MREGVPLFFLIGHLTHAQLAANLVLTMPKIVSFLEKHEPPFMARVHRPDGLSNLGRKAGRVELALTKELWEQMIAGPKRRRRI